jgi:hypothetical protein
VTQKRKLQLTIALIAGLGTAIALAWVGWRLYRVSKPTTTVARMRDLMGVLEAENPPLLTADSLAPILARNNRSECALDGWGRPFVIERVGPGERRFRIRSLGSDGREGPCCRGLVDSWEEDAVLEGETWLQQWSFGHSPAGR